MNVIASSNRPDRNSVQVMRWTNPCSVLFSERKVIVATPQAAATCMSPRTAKAPKTKASMAATMLVTPND
jgi:hypothetical protein